MNIVRDADKLEKLLAKYQIRDLFDTQDLQFKLYSYKKGEFLTSPEQPMTDLLFLVEGNIMIYGIHESARVEPVSYRGPMVLLGDMEFAGANKNVLFAQAASDVLCAALSVSRYENVIRRDAKFLYYMLRSVTEKFRSSTEMDLQNENLTQRVLFYLTYIAPDGSLKGIDAATYQLHCSRRQLQRVLKELCEKGTLKKTGRGQYRLVKR